MENKVFYFITILLALFLFGCKKSTFLDANPNQANVVPTTLNDFQAILNNDAQMNGNGGSGLVCSLGEAASDDYFDTTFASFPDDAKNLYTWDDNIYGNPKYDWTYSYRSVYYANVVLDGLLKLKIDASQKTAFDNAKGSALFFRAHMFYQLAQVFAPVYDSAAASTQMGICLRLNADINEKIERSTVSQTYSQILSDLNESLNLVPVIPVDKNHPSKTAVYALLARTYLSMGDYFHAKVYSDSCLSLQSDLIDFNTLDVSGSFIIPQYNSEVIFQSILIMDGVNTLLSIPQAVVDTNLIKSYDSNDLRTVAFFTPGPGWQNFQGSYDGSYYYFAGLATDEIFLIRAECNARFGSVDSALADLNALLIKRCVTGTFVTRTAVNAQDALQQILTERRKELIFRGLRWTDLRRLNKEGANITLTRDVNGQLYTLPPNGPHYTFLIPPDVLSFNPGMSQNNR